MKRFWQDPDERKITDRMQPGVHSREGFLGSDRRSLGEILDADRAAVEALRVTNERLAAKLAGVMEKAMAACGAPIKVNDHLLAVFREAMGRIPSPFGDGVFAKGEVELTDTRTGQTIRFTPLSVHLIAAHGFYQGIGSRYRIEPATLCRVFELPASKAGD